MDYKLGRIGIVPCDAYVSTRTYEQLDMVTYNGGSYIAKARTQGNPPTNTAYWMEAARKGDTGAQGAQGTPGLTTSVNGIQQQNGNITLTASDVGAYNKAETDVLLGPVSDALTAILGV